MIEKGLETMKPKNDMYVALWILVPPLKFDHYFTPTPFSFSNKCILQLTNLQAVFPLILDHLVDSNATFCQ